MNEYNASDYAIVKVNEHYEIALSNGASNVVFPLPLFISICEDEAKKWFDSAMQLDEKGEDPDWIGDWLNKAARIESFTSAATDGEVLDWPYLVLVESALCMIPRLAKEND